MQTLPLELQEYLLRFTGKHWSIAVRTCRSWWYLIGDPWQRSQINQRIFYSTLITPELAYWARLNGAEKSAKFTTVLARLGKFRELKVLCKRGYFISEETLLAAIRGAQFEVLDWLLKTFNIRLEETDASLMRFRGMCGAAVSSGSIPMMEKVLDLMKRKSITDLSVTMCTQAVERGDFQMLDWLLKQGYPVNHYDLVAAVRVRNLPMIKFLREKGVDWSVNALSIALDTGNKEIYLWLLENGSPDPQRTLLQAKERGWL